MGRASFAVFYLIFAVCTVYLNLTIINVTGQNAIFQTVTSAFSSEPFTMPGHPFNTPRYVTDIEDALTLSTWLSTSFNTTVFLEQQPATSLTQWGNSLKWNQSNTPATVGGFNRITLIRFTAKRFSLSKTLGKFAAFNPKKLAGSSTSVNPSATNREEDQSPACPPTMGNANITNSSLCYFWDKGNSFDGSGGYTDIFDPMDGPEALQAVLTKMNAVNMFDLKLASFTVDMIIYNTNIDMFLHYVWTFRFSFAGNCLSKNEARGFNLNVFNRSETKYLIVYLMRIACLLQLICFLLLEFQKMWDLGLIQHFRRSEALTDVVSILVSLAVLMTYYLIESNQIYSTFSFEALFNPATRLETFTQLCNLASSLQEQSLVIAFNLIVVSLRGTSLISCLHSDLGLIIEVLAVSMPNFIAFSIMFTVLLAGFVLMGYFTFGMAYAPMADPLLSLCNLFSMLAGAPDLGGMAKVDPIMAPIFFYIFYVFFYLVMLNIFVTLLMSGYDIVDYEIGQRRKKNGGEKEKNPLSLIFDELKSDVVGSVISYGGVFLRYGKVVGSHLLVQVEACLVCCPSPSCLAPLTRWWSSQGSNKGDSTSAVDLDENAKHLMDAGQIRRRARMLKIEFFTMIVFMAVWIVLMAFQTRGASCFYGAQATMSQPVTQVKWPTRSGLDVEGFSSIYDFAGVERWARSAILGLYEAPACANSDGGSFFVTSMNSTSICNKTIDSQQIINTINDWNIAFLNTTFVRLTIQPACFIPNPVSKWATGVPMLRKTPDADCASSVCTQIFDRLSCQTADGLQLSSTALASTIIPSTANWTNPLRYNFSKPGSDLGSFDMNGGLVFSLGSTYAEAKAMLDHLDEHRWFSLNSASMVFDWLLYNGNVDLFVHNKVSFSLLSTGLLNSDVSSTSFPLNVNAGGGFYYKARITILALFSLYTCLLMYHIFEMARTLARDIRLFKRRGVGVLASVASFFSEPWRVLDTISLIVSSAVLLNFLLFTIKPFRQNYFFSIDSSIKYAVPNDDVKKFNMAKATDAIRNLQDDWYFFLNFEDTQRTYDIFLSIAALNSLLIALKTIKIVNRMDEVLIFSETLSNGKGRNFYFLVVITQLLFGFSFCMMVIFGTTVNEFKDVFTTVATLFFWIVGSFDLNPLIEADEFLAVVMWVIFNVLFRFICVNMFLATQLNTFAELVGKLDIAKARAEADKDKQVRLVEYPSKDALKADITVQRQDDGEVVVRNVLQTDGPAAWKSVTPGHIIFKVNRQREEWKRDEVGDNIIEEGMQPDPVDGYIRIIFKEPPKDSAFQLLTNMFNPKPSQPVNEATNVKPTTKNFWKNHGAIAQVNRDVTTTRRVVSEEEEEQQHESGGDKGGVNSFKFMKDANNRLNTRNRLDSLLFSRWSNGIIPEPSLDSAPSTLGDNPYQGDGDLTEEDVLSIETWDIFDLKERVEKMPVTGQEVWLDCLIASVEHLDDEGVFTEVLRTADMQELTVKDTRASPKVGKIVRFYQNLDQVLKILEFKANRKYFQYLRYESEQRQKILRNQNEVLHDYVCQLEHEFTTVMESIHIYRTKKELLLTKLAGILDRGAYDHLDPKDDNAPLEASESHLQRLTRPWASRVQGAVQAAISAATS